ncbi:MAG TPA: SIS domain-containing protein [Methylobacter sp.]|jgi:D-sedoheptulose 7-phosphate isomerase
MKTTTRRDLSLPYCITQFGALLERSEITGKDGVLLGVESGILAVMQMLVQVRNSQGSVYVIGNGGSAGVASHTVIDLVNVAKLRAFTLHEPAVLTCMANDYAYENAFARLLGQMAKPGDVLIAISSSGNSKNIRNAALQMADNGGLVITLSGFTVNNSLRSLGDINIWLDSSDYGLVEIGHQFILHNISDRFGAGYEQEAVL